MIDKMARNDWQVPSAIGTGQKLPPFAGITLIRFNGTLSVLEVFQNTPGYCVANVSELFFKNFQKM